MAVHHRLRSRLAILGLGLAVAACGAPETPAASPAMDSGWVAFEGSWTAAGTRRTLFLGPDRRTSALSVSGSAVFAGASRPAAGFRADAIVLSDETTGVTGRAVWTDERGDQVYSELSGGGPEGDGRVHGTIVGGTGRFAGASGDYAFGWQYLLETEDGAVQGRTTGLRGRIRVTPATARP